MVAKQRFKLTIGSFKRITSYFRYMNLMYFSDEEIHEYVLLIQLRSWVLRRFDTRVSKLRPKRKKCFKQHPVVAADKVRIKLIISFKYQIDPLSKITELDNDDNILIAINDHNLLNVKKDTDSGEFGFQMTKSKATNID